MAERQGQPQERIADATAGVRHIFVRDLKLDARLGIHEREKLAPQRVIVNVDLTVGERGNPLTDDIANVVSYEKVVDHIRQIVAQGHVNLVETLAEMIAARCLENDWVKAVRVRVEKPDIIPQAESVGVEIERRRLP